MTQADGSSLDDHQYTAAGLRAYEGIYGRDFVSPGGRRTTAEILHLLDWSKGTRVLDVGCGLGGAMFMMATEFEADVHGIDLSRHMADAAGERSAAYGLDARITVAHGDILTIDLPGRFDIVHSREVFLHIHDKPTLFARLHDALEPGGQLLFTDYCRGAGPPTDAFRAYVEEFGYDLRTVEEIATLLGEAGFNDVSAIDQTEQFIEIHYRELNELQLSDLTAEEQAELRAGWLAKISRAKAGEQCWGWFRGWRDGS